MLSEEKIVIKCKNAKPEKFSVVCNYVRFEVRSYEREKLFTPLKATAEAIAEVHKEEEGFSALTCAEDVVRDTLASLKKENGDAYTTEEADAFVNGRGAVAELDAVLDSLGVTAGGFKALPASDRLFIDLQAHTALPGIKLQAGLFAEADISNIVKKYYQTGNLKDARDMLRSMFDKLLGSDGELFYGVKLKKSDLPAEDVRNFFARFRGTARRTSSTSDGVTTYGLFKYRGTEASKNVQASAVTDFFAVTLDAGKNYEVLKPEAEKTGEAEGSKARKGSKAEGASNNRGSKK